MLIPKALVTQSIMILLFIFSNRSTAQLVPFDQFVLNATGQCGGFAPNDPPITDYWYTFTNDQSTARFFLGITGTIDYSESSFGKCTTPRFDFGSNSASFSETSYIELALTNLTTGSGGFFSVVLEPSATTWACTDFSTTRTFLTSPNKPVQARSRGILRCAPIGVEKSSIQLSNLKIGNPLCKVSDQGRNVPFQTQVDPRWAADPFGVSELSVNKGTMREYGCSITAADMIFESYGIKNTPLGGPTNPATAIPFFPLPGLEGGQLSPGSLNKAMANYTKPFISPIGATVALNSNNDPYWPGVVEVARAGYRAQCQNTANLCDPNNAPNVVSFKPGRGLAFGTQERQEVEDEICNGNPVMLKFKKANGGQHFMLATGYKLDDAGNKTFILNNPGITLGKDQEYSGLFKQKYPTILGYVLFRPSSDPSMQIITAPQNVHFVVTDSQGRRTGFNPLTNTSYSEIPEAGYTNQSIDTPNEDGFLPKTLVAERYYSANEVSSGQYQVQVFGVESGTYYLDYRGYDSSGSTNASSHRVGDIQAGATASQSFTHSTDPAPEDNATLKVDKYMIEKSSGPGFKKSEIRLKGKVSPNIAGAVELKSSFTFEVGQPSGYRLSIPASEFKIKKELKSPSQYVYDKQGVKIKLSSLGEFEIEVDRADLSSVSPDQMGNLKVIIDSLSANLFVELECHKDTCILDEGRRK
jgi:hypothetical protein